MRSGRGVGLLVRLPGKLSGGLTVNRPSFSFSPRKRRSHGLTPNANLQFWAVLPKEVARGAGYNMGTEYRSDSPQRHEADGGAEAARRLLLPRGGEEDLVGIGDVDDGAALLIVDAADAHGLEAHKAARLAKGRGRGGGEKGAGLFRGLKGCARRSESVV